jgi:hypothetical protein
MTKKTEELAEKFLKALGIKITDKTIAEFRRIVADEDKIPDFSFEEIKTVNNILDEKPRRPWITEERFQIALLLATTERGSNSADNLQKSRKYRCLSKKIFPKHREEWFGKGVNWGDALGALGIARITTKTVGRTKEQFYRYVQFHGIKNQYQLQKISKLEGDGWFDWYKRNKKDIGPIEKLPGPEKEFDIEKSRWIWEKRSGVEKKKTKEPEKPKKKPPVEKEEMIEKPRPPVLPKIDQRKYEGKRFCPTCGGIIYPFHTEVGGKEYRFVYCHRCDSKRIIAFKQSIEAYKSEKAEWEKRKAEK